MAGAIVPHETDVNLTNLHFPSAAEPQLKRENRFFDVIFITETQSPHGSTVREPSRQAASTAFSAEPVEESPRAEFFIAAHPELSRRTRLTRLRGEFFSGSIQ